MKKTILSILALLGLASMASATVVPTGGTTFNGAPGNASFSIPYTTRSGPNDALVVFVTSGNNDVISVSFAGSNFTQLTNVAGAYGMAAWGLTSTPSSTTGNIIINTAGLDYIVGSVAEAYNVTGFGAVVENIQNTTATSYLTGITTTANNSLVMAAFTSGFNNPACPVGFSCGGIAYYGGVAYNLYGNEQASTSGYYTSRFNITAPMSNGVVLMVEVQTTGNTPTTSPTPTFSPTLTWTNTFTNSPTVSPTISPTFSVSPTKTSSTTLTATPTPSATRTFTWTNTPGYSPTPTASPTFSVSPTATPTPSPTGTFTATPTSSPTLTFTITKTVTPTATKTSSPTPSITFTMTFTPTATQTATPTPSPTISATVTPTPSMTPLYISPGAQQYIQYDPPNVSDTALVCNGNLQSIPAISLGPGSYWLVTVPTAVTTPVLIESAPTQETTPVAMIPVQAGTAAKVPTHPGWVNWFIGGGTLGSRQEY